MTAAQASSRPRTAEENAQVEAALIDLHDRLISFNQLLRLKTLSLKPGDVRSRLDMRPELVGHFQYGRLHGGVISAVLDTVGGMACLVGIADRHPNDTVQQALQRFSRLGTIDLRVDFLRQGLGQHFIASAELTRLGGRVGSTQMRLVNDEGTLIATAAAAYVVA